MVFNTAIFLAWQFAIELDTQGFGNWMTPTLYTQSSLCGQATSHNTHFGLFAREFKTHLGQHDCLVDVYSPSCAFDRLSRFCLLLRWLRVCLNNPGPNALFSSQRKSEPRRFGCHFRSPDTAFVCRFPTRISKSKIL